MTHYPPGGTQGSGHPNRITRVFQKMQTHENVETHRARIKQFEQELERTKMLLTSEHDYQIQILALRKENERLCEGWLRAECELIRGFGEASRYCRKERDDGNCDCYKGIYCQRVHNIVEGGSNAS